jgi:2'-5' RNA ligase
MTTNSHAAEYEAAWTRFHSLSGLIHGFETIDSPWARGRDRYGAFLVRVEDPAARDHLRPLAERLATVPALTLYPERYWHITIKTLGFLVTEATSPDEVQDASLASIVEAASTVFDAQPPFDLRIGPINAFPDVVIAEIWDDGAVRRLNTALLDAMPGLLRHPFDGPHFLPHVSLARYASNGALDKLKATLSDLRDVGPGPTLHVPAIELITAHIGHEAPLLETTHTFPLRPPS